MKSKEFVLVLIGLSFAVGVDPNDYIWFNYDEQITVQPHNA